MSTERKNRMQVRMLALVLIAVAYQQVIWAQTPVARYSITISLPNATIKAGSEARVQVVQKNTTNQDQPFWDEKVAGLNGEYLYLIDVLQSDGTKPQSTKYFREVRDDAGNFLPGTAGNGWLITKRPGETITSSFDLNELYELKPGKYTVQVSQRDNVSKISSMLSSAIGRRTAQVSQADDIATVVVKSNILTVKVTP